MCAQLQISARLSLVVLLLIVGCGRTQRSRDEIFAEKMSLPQLYVGLKSKKRIEAPISKGVFVDDETQDEFWPAMECRNPHCPARKSGEPVLFVLPRDEKNRSCPTCKKVEFVAPYVLPDTKARLRQLDEELAQRK